MHVISCKCWLLIVVILLVVVMTLTNGQLPDAQITIRNQNIRALRRSYFAKYEDTNNEVITEIDMQRNRIIYVESVAFGYFSEVAYLDLGNNELSSFSPILPNLIDLDLSYNKFDKIEPSLFEKYPSLKSINLAGNNLGQISWSLNLHENIQFIDVSSNLGLQMVHIKSTSLIALTLVNDTRVTLDLLTPKLEILDLRSTYLSGAAMQPLCLINREQNQSPIITYTTSDGLVDRFDCSQVQAESILPILPESDYSLESLVETKLVGCQFSTLKANYGDVILTQEEWETVYICFVTLAGLVVFLSIFIMCIGIKIVMRGRSEEREKLSNDLAAHRIVLTSPERMKQSLSV